MYRWSASFHRAQSSEWYVKMKWMINKHAHINRLSLCVFHVSLFLFFLLFFQCGLNYTHRGRILNSCFESAVSFFDFINSTYKPCSRIHFIFRAYVYVLCDSHSFGFYHKRCSTPNHLFSIWFDRDRNVNPYVRFKWAQILENLVLFTENIYSLGK